MKFKYLFLVLLTSTSWAIPKKYNNCPIASRIQMPKQSSGFYLSEDCKTVYVLPPVVGSVKMSKPITTLDSELCAATMSVIDTIKNQTTEIANAQKQFGNYQENTVERSTHLRELKQECIDVNIKMFEFNEKLKVFDLQLAQQKNKREKQISELNKCQTLNGEDSYKCRNLTREIDRLSKTITEGEVIESDAFLKKSIFEIQKSNCEAKVEFLTNTSLNDDTNFKQLQNELFKIMDTYREMLNQALSDEENKEGALFGMNILSGHNSLVTEFIDLNDNLVKNENISFVKIPIKKAVINFAMIINGPEAGIPVIFGSHINGFIVDKQKEGLVTAELKSSVVSAVEAFMGEGIGGNVILNRLATCKMMQKTGAKFGNQLSASDIANTIRPTLKYEYEVQVDRRIRVAFTESHFYQLIKKSIEAKSGLFETKTLNSLFENSEASKWIDIEFFSEDGDHAFVDPLTMAIDIKREYAQAALTNVAKSYLSSEQLNLINGGETAATGASKAIKECKHPYCQAAGIVLDVTNALFSGSNEEANMTKIVKATSKITINDKKSVSLSGTQVFEASGQ